MLINYIILFKDEKQGFRKILGENILLYLVVLEPFESAQKEHTS